MSSIVIPRGIHCHLWYLEQESVLLYNWGKILSWGRSWKNNEKNRRGDFDKDIKVFPRLPDSVTDPRS